jgi:hypothetical protein
MWLVARIATFVACVSPGAAHQPDVGPRDLQDPRGAERCRGHRADRSRPGARVGVRRVGRQERGEVRGDGDGTDPRAAATVGDAERLVQVEV